MAGKPRRGTKATPTPRPRRTTSRSRSRSTWAATVRSTLRVSPGTLRSILGLVLLVLGAVTLIALFLPSAGILNRYVDGVLHPGFGLGAWLLAVLLLVAGVLVERSPTVGTGWGMAAIGGLICFLGAEGLIHLVSGQGSRPADLAQGGGWVGNWFSSTLTALVSAPGAFVVLLGITVAGILLLFNLTLREMFRPVQAGGRAVASVASATVAVALPRAPDAADGNSDVAPEPRPAATRGRARSPEAGAAPGPVRGTAGASGSSAAALSPAAAASTAPPPELPTPISSPVPISQTVWAGSAAIGVPSETGRLTPAPSIAPAGGRASVGLAEPAPIGSGVPGAAENGAGDAGPVAPPKPRTWILPPLDDLDPHAVRAVANGLDHDLNIRIITDKLRSFQIHAEVVATNTGPVVTQYEVKPDPNIKLSRIEALADDLAMALAARSIRIVAPIPGRDVVGIEIPNHSADVVGFRRLYEDAQMAAATSKLTFALGRDVSGKAYAVDLARMPHLLIAGATGSGKSVCVNALITSFLMRATPDEVRLVLVDLKRVELAQYDRLPHLLTSVIVEAHHARAALNWAVGEMEERYKKLAGRSERNIAAYNSSYKVPPDERLPYIVIVIDELADLMMREGRKVEDPVVKLAQKARAVGIHLVLATQRPSVNVVTGLIKANVPSRIAFAMSSNVDSRTVLDQPGAEDLIGRGDMLYQPADLPRPVRLQGVFVSDAEVRAVTDFWRDQAPETDYDADLLEGAEEEGGDGGQFGWLVKAAEDPLTPRAAELVMLTGKASTSMMQTKLKVGFNRASRLMEELEQFGIVGPQDPRNPAVPRQVYGPENWLRSMSDVDDD